MIRTNTANVSVTASMPAGTLLPTSFFTSQPVNTADIITDVTNGKYTVSIAGWYLVTGRIKSTYAGSTGSNMWTALLLYKNGTIAQWGNGGISWDEGTAGYTGGPPAISGVWLIYLNVNDYVQLGYANNSSISSITGEATGTQTYFGIALLNKSLV